MARGTGHAPANDVIEVSDSDSDGAGQSAAASRHMRKPSEWAFLESPSHSFNADESDDFERPPRRDKRPSPMKPTKVPKKQNAKVTAKAKRTTPVKQRKTSSKQQRKYSDEDEDEDDEPEEERPKRVVTRHLFSDHLTMSELQAQERELTRLRALNLKAQASASEAHTSSHTNGKLGKPSPAKNPTVVAVKPSTVKPKPASVSPSAGFGRTVLATTLARKQQELGWPMTSSSSASSKTTKTNTDVENGNGERRRPAYEGEEEEEEEEEEEIDEEEVSDDFEDDIVEAKKAALRASLALAQKQKNKPSRVGIKSVQSTPSPPSSPPPPPRRSSNSKDAKKKKVLTPPSSPSPPPTPPSRRSSNGKFVKTTPTKSNKYTPTKSNKPTPTYSNKPTPTKSTKPTPTKSTEPTPTRSNKPTSTRSNKPTQPVRKQPRVTLPEEPRAKRHKSGQGLLSEWLSVSELQAQEREWSRLQRDLKSNEPPAPPPPSKSKDKTRRDRTAASRKARADSETSSDASLVDIIELIEDDDDEEEDAHDNDAEFMPPVAPAPKKKANTSKSKKTAPRRRPSAPLKPPAPRPASQPSNGNSKLPADVLAKPRTAAETVPHGTTWRRLSFPSAPVNLLPLPAEMSRPFESTVDKPLIAFDDNGDLDDKCRLLSSFGKSKSFLLTSDPSKPALSQEKMNERVVELLETWMPRIKGCYTRKSNAIVQEARAKTAEYVRLRDEKIQAIIKRGTDRHALPVEKLSVCGAERALAQQLLLAKGVYPLDVKDAAVKVGRDETFHGEKEIIPHAISELAVVRQISRSTTFIGITASVRVEDDPILRYVPYFGDHDNGDAIDVKAYDAVRAKDAADGAKSANGLDNEAHEYMLRLVIAEYGDLETVFNALKHIAGFAQPYTEYCEIKKRLDAREAASKRMQEIREFMANDKEADEDAATRVALKHLTQNLHPFADKKRERVPLAERLASHWTFFNTNLVPSQSRPVKAFRRLLGLRHTTDYVDLSETYRDLFCRMCYKYDCPEHGIEHPMPTRRVDPLYPTTRYSPLVVAEGEVKDDDEDEEETKPAAREEKDEEDEEIKSAEEEEKVDDGDEETKPSAKAVNTSEEEGASSQQNAVALVKKAEEETEAVDVDETKPSANEVHVSEEVETASQPTAVAVVEKADGGDNKDDNGEPTQAMDVMDLASESSATTAESQETMDLSAMEPRRSSRSGTRASTLATINIESQLIMQGFKTRAQRSRGKPAPKRTKGGDESEYLDDSHRVLIASKVRKFLKAGETCSARCWKVDETEAKAATGGDDFTEPEEEIQSRLTTSELLVLQKLRYTVGDNACMIASVLQSLSCREVHTYLVSQQRNKPTDQQGYFSPDVSGGKKNRKRGRATTALPGNNRELLKRTRHQRLKDTSSANHDYEPCNHEGICDFGASCSCMKRDHMCEKACSCSRDCPNRFQGCKCSMGNCRTNQCSCFVAMRECNPDLCHSCGASDVPVLVYNPAFQSVPSQELGICCNVNVQRGLHKRLGASYSRTHGWGAFALEPIKKGEFIYEYTGAIISHDEAERRGSIYDKLNISFLFDLNEDSVADAIRTGNKSKFCNHANVGQKCHARIFRVGGEHHISIWALADIRKGEELFFNYGYHGESAPVWSQGARITETSKREADEAAAAADTASETGTGGEPEIVAIE